MQGDSTLARALISVWDKTGIAELAGRLSTAGFEILSTGGTARALRDAGVSVTDVSAVTGFPEILDGRVKTLHPFVHAGLLARRDTPEHMETLQKHHIQPIDLLVSNLYPFEAVSSSSEIDDNDAIENIDIGGPAMIRAAAKNHAGVVVLVNPDDYNTVLDAIETSGMEGVSVDLRRRLGATAFGHVSRYDSLVAAYLREKEPLFPEEFTLGGRLVRETSYGENPHQRAAVYASSSSEATSGVGAWTVKGGGDLSYNNYLDASAAWATALAFQSPAVVIVKHTLPCGVGSHENLAEAFRLALSGDPVSAYGGVLACNQVVTEDMARAIGKLLLHVMIAPGYEDGALAILQKKRSLRIVSTGGVAFERGLDVRTVPGGFLLQEEDREPVDSTDWKVVTGREPTADELTSLEFAWRVVPFVKSNAIVVAATDHVVGIGAGQPNRVESVKIATRVAGERARGTGLASDAFFPFADGVEAAAEAGVSAIVQPGGSVRDQECIDAANRHGIAMLFTGKRHFRH
jgi:phosphoribosylaminoimidazolecarboxamide formyltransferase / IMP cyclohydrolase